jgi:hypothetical protein
MITEFIEGGLDIKTIFFSDLVDVVKKKSEGTAWVWLSKKETIYSRSPPNPCWRCISTPQFWEGRVNGEGKDTTTTRQAF